MTQTLLTDERSDVLSVLILDTNDCDEYHVVERVELLHRALE